MKSLKPHKNQQGQSTLELMIAMFVMVVFMVGIVVVVFGNQFLSLDSDMSNTAINKAQAALEEQRGNAKDNFQGIVAGATTDGPYTKKITVNNINQCQKEVTSIVAWPTGSGATKQVSLTTLITNIAEQIAMGGQCSGLGVINPALTCPKADGSGAEIIGGQQYDTNQTINGATATGVRVVNNVAYLTSVSANPADPDFWVLNIDTNNYYTVTVDRPKSINTASGGLNALEIAGNYAYAASASSTAQLQIIDISANPPTVVKSFGLPGNASAATAVAYRNGYVYIGTNTGFGNEFNIVDVSNQLSPHFVKSYAVGGKVNKINTVGNLVYLATSNPNKQLLGMDVTNPLAATAPYILNPSGSTGMQSLYFLGSKLYSGAITGSHPNFFQTNLADFSLIGSADISVLDSNVTGKINDMVATGNLVFLGTSAGSDGNGNFLILDVSNPAMPTACPNTMQTFIPAISSPGMDTSVKAMDFKDGLFYIVLNNNLPLIIIKPNY